MKGSIKLPIFLVALLASVTVLVSAQTKDDVINAYNEGAELAKTDTKGAIDQFNLVHQMALTVGTESDDIRILIETQLPVLQLKYANELYKARNIAEAIPNYIIAKELAQEVGDTATISKTTDIIPKLYLQQGNDLYKNGDLENALVNLDKALEFNPEYAKVYLSKGLVYKKQDNIPAMLEAMEKAIEFGEKTNDEKTVTSAGNVIRDNYLMNAQKEINEGNFAEAIVLLEKARLYGEPKAGIFYLLAVSNNKLSKWDDAIVAVNNGLPVEEDTPEAKAKFYFELGNAYVGNGNTSEACAAYKNALYGKNMEAAKYQIETVLKCN
jgi:tetratricopeptide (TPR) repeat protein